MDVFSLQNRVVDHYADYIQSFINIRDARIRDYVDTELKNGLLWPEPLLQLNPSFEPGASIDELVAARKLHPTCREIFQIKEEGKPNAPLRLHKHQAEAIEAAASKDNYVLTTGTGSGKSLAYIIPIVNYVLTQGSGKGIRAIVVYPMNALANSQQIELEKFLQRGFPAGQPPVTFRRYTGQERNAERDEILAHPPDILLTNYVMLELLLTRPYEKQLVNAARGRLQFLVLDELHTYRGRQGADVSLLVRRVRNICGNPRLQCVGTSATMAGGGTFAEQQTAWDLQPFAQDCGYDGPPFRWDEERRFLLRCELDAAYFHLYGIARDDVDYIMETFPIVKRKDMAKHGEYRTKRVILEIYDEMAEAMRSGIPYQTRLDPPPADPRVAHPQRVIEAQR